jgi:anti-sigma B factor antagonist
MTDSSAGSLRVTLSVDAEVVTVTLAGEFDLAAAPEFRSRADEALDAGTAAVVLDLAELSFIDSTGIAALLELHRRLASAGRTMRLVNVGPQPAGVLDITGVSGTDLEIVTALVEPPTPPAA